MGKELSDDAPIDGARDTSRETSLERPKLLVGLVAPGEKVPWLQGPSRASLKRPVVSDVALG